MNTKEIEVSEGNSESKNSNQSDFDKEIFEKEERRLKLKNLKIDLWVKPLSFFSAIIAFTLAFVTITGSSRQNEKLENEKYILEEKISVSQTPINSKSSLLAVDIELINRGGNTIKPYAHAVVSDALYKNEGLYFIVYEIPTQPDRLIGNDEGVAVYGPHNILDKYSNSSKKWYESYRIKPHTTYHEGEAIILERKKLYQVLARFFVFSGADSGSTITESRYVYID
jgi:hypothetical protein